jgi:beta-lactamase regulating signal transducer with metallopeptidase domain
MKTGDDQEVQMIQKILLVVWVVVLAGLLCMVGYILLYGSTVHRKSLAEDLGILWAFSFGAWAYLTWKARQ